MMFCREDDTEVVSVIEAVEVGLVGDFGGVCGGLPVGVREVGLMDNECAEVGVIVCLTCVKSGVV
jgi:hypothetical protein